MTVRGSCLCGAVSFAVSAPLGPIVACHCGQCRRTSGHHVTATAAPREAVHIEGHVAWYRSSETARRGFCATCGSNLFWDDNSDELSIMAGSLDQPTGLRLSRHIFVADKGDYYDIADGLPQAAQWSEVAP